ncbi:hypothetical protein HU200_057211 [Digitaria exilis]|uniref:Secreted protein n=1 Tax=Digitaria exilis TaxID=1010633 RepID=A0A835AL88_9POAL|nr:hypothetical protein HU200_057211 [Digitaria exilis]
MHEMISQRVLLLLVALLLLTLVATVVAGEGDDMPAAGTDGASNATIPPTQGHRRNVGCEGEEVVAFPGDGRPSHGQRAKGAQVVGSPPQSLMHLVPLNACRS